jgi:hypothetical protein
MVNAADGLPLNTFEEAPSLQRAKAAPIVTTFGNCQPVPVSWLEIDFGTDVDLLSRQIVSALGEKKGQIHSLHVCELRTSRKSNIDTTLRNALQRRSICRVCSLTFVCVRDLFVNSWLRSKEELLSITRWHSSGNARPGLW